MLQPAEEKRRLVYVLPQDARLCTDITPPPPTPDCASSELRKCDFMYIFPQTLALPKLFPLIYWTQNYF
jgi:hypothetical protein